MKNEFIYIVTSGSYSEYGIEYVTTSKDDAENYLSKSKGNRPDIEIWKNGEDKIQNYFMVKCRTNTLEVFYIKEIYEISYLILNECDVSYFLGRKDENYQFLTITVKAKDKDHAIKIAAEKFAEYKYNLEVKP